jgi:hypothetical protein
MWVAEWFVRMLGAYAAVGSLFAVAFVARGIHRADPVAKGAPLGFRLIVLPGAAALWPLLAVRWAKGMGGTA